MGRRRTLITALALSPPIAALVAAPPYLLMSPYPPDDLTEALVPVVMAAAFVGYPAMIALGLPSHAALLRWEKRNWPFYVIAGVLSGFVVAFALSLLLEKAFFEVFVTSMLTSAICALVFWLIRRPDRDANSSVIPDTPQA